MKRLFSLKNLLYFILCVAIVAITVRSCSSKPVAAPSALRASGGDTIDVAIEYNPMSMYRYGDSLAGFSYELLKLMAYNDSILFNYHPVSTVDEALPLLEDGVVDIVVSDIPAMADYKNRFMLSKQIYLDRQVLVQRKDSTGNLSIPDQLTLAGKTIFVPHNSPSIIRLRNLSAEIGDTIYVNDSTEYGAEQLVILTAIGDIDYAVVNERIAKKLAPDYPALDISTNVSFTQFQTWIMRLNDSGLSDRINRSIKRIKSTSQYDSLCVKYGC